MRHTRTRAVLVLIAGALAACDAGGNGAQATVATTGPTGSLPTTTTAASGTTTTDAAVASVPAGAVTLSPEGRWRLVDSAPGVTQPGLIYQLMPGLWVYLPVKEDIPKGITWVLNEKDRPIIEAYLMARLTYFQAITSDPINVDLPGWKQWYTDGGALYRPDLLARKKQGQVADLDVGVVLRPQVIGEERTDTTAVVFDCFLDGGVFRLPDGSLAPGSTPGVVPYGSVARLSLTGSRWIVKQNGQQPDACL